MAGYDLFEVGAKCIIQRNGRVPQPGLTKNFRNGPPAAVRHPNDGHRAMVLLYDYLHTFPDFLQYGVEIAGEFGF